MRRDDLHQANRASWNAATRAHNSHKPNQAAFLEQGGEVLFEEDYEMLGELEGKDVAHLLCNSGQDSLCLARRGARVTGVDISDEAIETANRLSQESGIAASFERADVYDWLEGAAKAGRTFDTVYASYGWSIWLSDLPLWAQGVSKILRPGGRLVLLEFHPYAMVFERDWSLRYPYFGGANGEVQRFDEGVGDYVAQSGDALTPGGYAQGVDDFQNEHACFEFAWTVSDRLEAFMGAGLEVQSVREWPHSNGFAPFDGMVPVPGDGRRWTTGPERPSLPLMLGIRCIKPH